MSSTSIFGTGLRYPQESFPRAPNHINTSVMTLASSAASLTIPAGAQYVRLAGTEDFFALWGSTDVSTGAHSTGLGSEYVPKNAPILRSIGSTLGTTAISVISTAAACTVTQSWWTV